MAEGNCTCGAIKITTQGKPLQTVLCVCEHCQRATSNIGQVVAAYRPKQVTIEDPKRQLKEYTMNETESGKPKVMKFCGNCGQGVAGFPTKFGVAVLRPSILNDPQAVLPTKLQWAKSGNQELQQRIKSLL